MMNVKIVFLEISSDSAIDGLIKLVSIEKQEKIKRFRFDIDRKLCLYSELLVRYHACQELSLSNKEIVFGKSKNGKPFLLDYPKFYFNISHTRNAIAIAFSNSAIGIDIESIKPIDLAIAKRFFTSFEQKYIISHDNPDYAFYKVWTKKEAYIKHIGTGLSTPLNSFNVLDDSLGTMMYTFSVEQYIISICCNGLIKFKPIISTIAEDELHLLFNEIT